MKQKATRSAFFVSLKLISASAGADIAITWRPPRSSGTLCTGFKTASLLLRDSRRRVLDDHGNEIIFDSFENASTLEVLKIRKRLPSKSCEVDPIRTWLLKSSPDVIVPMRTQIVNLSLKSGHFRHLLKTAYVRPLPKKPHLDPDDFSNYRPVSNLPFPAKIIDWEGCCCTPKSSFREARSSGRIPIGI